MDNDLQFDRAEFDAPRATACSACQATLTTEYFSVNGRIFCAKCAEGIRQHFGAGERADLPSRSILLGLGAAAVGGAVYAAVLMYGGFGRILGAVGAGWLVGKAVRKGSGNRGGEKCQWLAAFLTYLAIAGAFGAKMAIDFGPPANAAGALNFLGDAVIAPFTQRGGVFGLVAVVVGVVEAWQLNRAVRLEITGPHALGGAAPTPGV